VKKQSKKFICNFIATFCKYCYNNTMNIKLSPKHIVIFTLVATIVLSVAVAIGVTVGLKIGSTNNASALPEGVTTAPLPLQKGGTGVSLTTAPSLITDLASTAAASPLTATPAPGVKNTLPIAHGGTGATSVNTALANLGINTLTQTGTNISGLNNAYKNAQSSPCSSSTCYVTYVKIGKVVTMSFWLNNTTSAAIGQNTSVFSIPDGYKPAQTNWFQGANGNAQNGSYVVNYIVQQSTITMSRILSSGDDGSHTYAYTYLPSGTYNFGGTASWVTA
jgi:hypothetical protein